MCNSCMFNGGCSLLWHHPPATVLCKPTPLCCYRGRHGVLSWTISTCYSQRITITYDHIAFVFVFVCVREIYKTRFISILDLCTTFPMTCCHFHWYGFLCLTHVLRSLLWDGLVLLTHCMVWYSNLMQSFILAYLIAFRLVAFHGRNRQQSSFYLAASDQQVSSNRLKTANSKTMANY